MKKNVGQIDRIIRIIVGLIILAVGYYFRSWWGLVGLLPLLTAIIGYCPPYQLFGINTIRSASGQTPPPQQ
jgi:predicted RND superfamily exporter protein